MQIALMNKRFVLMGAIFALLVGLTPFSTTRAAEQGTDTLERIAISPTSKRYNLDAGQTLNDEVTVINDGDTSFDFVVYARPYSVTDEAYTTDFATPKQNADAYQWVKFEKTSFSLAPRQTVKVKYSLMVPKGVAPGGHYGAIFAETETKDKASGASVIRKKRVGSLLYATVKGNYRTEGRVEAITLPFWQPLPPLTASVRTTNTGNTDFMVKGRHTVKDMLGRTKFQLNSEKPVLPGTTRVVKYEWEQSPGFGLFNVTTSVEVLGKTATRSGLVLVMPQWAVIAVLLLLIGAIVYAAIRFFGNKKRK